MVTSSQFNISKRKKKKKSHDRLRFLWFYILTVWVILVLQLFLYSAVVHFVRRTTTLAKNDTLQLLPTHVTPEETAQFQLGRDGLPELVHKKKLPYANMFTFEQSLQEWSSSEKFIILVQVDGGVLSMAYNLIETSFLKHQIVNFLFVSLNEAACRDLNDHGFPCFLHQSSTKGNRYTPYGSLDFHRKVQIRSKYVLIALQMGYDVLLMDTDIVFLQNPLKYFLKYPKYDVLPLAVNNSTLNAGFVYIRASEESSALYRLMIDIANRYPTIPEQKRFNIVVKRLQWNDVDIHLNVKPLPHDKFQAGTTFWKLGNRHFHDDNKCQTCVVVHNNQIIGLQNKIWRMKEMLMWSYDKAGYYSSTEAKYLTFRTPVWFGTAHHTVESELKVLLKAVHLGRLLNRLIILPRFRGYSQLYWHNLGELIDMDALNGTVRQMLRENSFLQNPKVQEDARTCKRDLITVESIDAKNNIIVLPEFKDGISASQIEKWQNMDDRLLCFDTLYSIPRVTSDDRIMSFADAGILINKACLKC